MNKESGSMVFIGILLALGMFAAAGMAGNAKADDSNNTRMIETMGYATLSVEPDTLSILVGAETQNEDADVSQRKNADIMDKVKNSIESLGIADIEIETTQYDLYPVREWNDRYSNYRIIGYNTVHIYKVTTKQTEKAGKIVDAAVGSGANRVDGIGFEVSDERMSELKTQVLGDAAKNAKDKAWEMAKSLGVSVTGIEYAREGLVYYAPMYSYASYAEADSKAGGASTPVSPGKTQISATMNAGFIFG